MRILRSIRVRLLVLIGLLLLVVLGSFGYVAWRRESAARIAAVDRELKQRLNMLIGGLRPRMGERLSDVREPRLSPHARELFQNEGGAPFYFVVWLADGRVQGRSDDAPELPFPGSQGEERVLRDRDDHRELVHLTPTGRRLLVGRSIRSDLVGMRKDAASLATVAGGVLLVGLGFAAWIAAQITRPLAEVSRTAKHIAAGDLSRRIDLADADAEIAEVSRALNDTFSSLEAGIARQRQFAADASHELRTPVSLILAHAQGALLHEQSPAEYREALADCERAARRMKTLIESLLDLARFDAAAETLRKEDCDLADLTRECFRLLQPLADSKRLKLELDLQAAPCHGDPDRLTQVIVNLLTNAINFTDPEGTIRLRTFQDEATCFSISDTGIGIEAEHLQHLFERFHRADTSRARKTGGNGLGLAICKAIVEAHGGSISVVSRPSKGTSFLLRLPTFCSEPDG